MNVFAAILFIVLIQGNFFQLKVHLKQLVIREHTQNNSNDTDRPSELNMFS